MLGLLQCMSLDLVPSRQFATTQHLGRFGDEADIWAPPSQNRIYEYALIVHRVQMSADVRFQMLRNVMAGPDGCLVRRV